MGDRRMGVASLFLAVALPTVAAAVVHPPASFTRRQCGSLLSGGAAACLYSAAPAVGASTPAASASSSVATLTSGLAFPLASFGLQVYDDAMAERLTRVALEVGYRNFFASVLARNQRGFARAVKASGVPREELFICGSVVSDQAQGFDNAYRATTRGWKENMEAFSAGDIGYLDQIMLDYPGPDCESIRGQWRAFEEMREKKLVKSLAVSNFSYKQLDCLLSTPGATPPDVNQLAFNVGLYGSRSKEVIEENRKRGVLVQAWSPLGGGRGLPTSIKAKCAEIGKRRGKSSAQVALRWILQSGACFTTQTKSREHFEEDLNVFDFTLSDEDMASLST